MNVLMIICDHQSFLRNRTKRSKTKDNKVTYLWHDFLCADLKSKAMLPWQIEESELALRTAYPVSLDTY